MKKSLRSSKTRLSLQVAIFTLAASSLVLTTVPANAQASGKAQGEGRDVGTILSASIDLLRGAEVRVEGFDIVSVTDNGGERIRHSLPGKFPASDRA